MGFFRQKQPQPTRRTGRHARVSVGELAESRPQDTFRRNRTLTGSLVSGVKGVSERHAELRSTRLQTHDLHHHRKRLWVALLGTVAAASLLGFIIAEFIATPHVTLVADTPGNQKLYTQKIQDYLNGHFFERSRLTIDTARLTTYLQDNGLPEVQSIAESPRSDGIGAAMFVIAVRKPVVSWSTGNKTLYVDENGNAFEHNYFDIPGVQVVDQTGIQAQGDQILVSDRFLGFIGKAVGQMKDQGYTVTRVTIPPNTTRQIWLSVEGLGYSVKMTVDRPAAGQAEDAARAIRYVTARGIAVAAYVDVRVSGKAYYQ